MKISLPENPNARFASDDGRSIECDVVMAGDTYRFTASPDDVEAHGRAVFAILMLTPDKIAPYEPPAQN